MLFPRSVPMLSTIISLDPSVDILAKNWQLTIPASSLDVIDV
jgi:hypothetical protein